MLLSILVISTKEKPEVSAVIRNAQRSTLLEVGMTIIANLYVTDATRNAVLYYNPIPLGTHVIPAELPHNGANASFQMKVMSATAAPDADFGHHEFLYQVQVVYN